MAGLKVHNDKQSISRLPNELLYRIFAEGYLSPGAAGFAQIIWTCCDSKRYIAQVCSRWRAVALGCPHMWCEVDLSTGIRWISEVLKRSQDLPIEVYIPRSTKQERITLAFRTQRIRGVYGHVKDGDLAVKVLDAIRELGALEEINFILPHTGQFRGSKQLLTSSLRRLWLTGPSIPLSSTLNFPTLTCLHVNHPWHTKTASQWLTIIRRLPLLHELCLRHCIKTDDSRSDFVGFEPEILLPLPPPIKLLNLEKLELRGHHCACGFIFRALLVPASCTLTFMTHDANIGPTIDALITFLKSSHFYSQSYVSPLREHPFTTRSLLLRIGATSLRLRVFDKEVTKLNIKLLYEDCYEYRMGIAASVMERLLSATFDKFRNHGGFDTFTLSLVDLGKSSQKIEAWSYWFIKSAGLLRGIPNVRLEGTSKSHRVLDFLKREAVPL